MRTNETQQELKSRSQGTSERRPYEAPRLTKKRSVARVTLFSGGLGAGGAVGVGGVTAA